VSLKFGHSFMDVTARRRVCPFFTFQHGDFF
jgi:hypothetical protein